MASYTKFSELTGSSQTALITAVHPAGVSNTSVVTQEYIFDEDAELDYSASFTDGMSAATVTFSELPSNTVAVWAELSANDSGGNPAYGFKRSSGGTDIFYFGALFADAGVNNNLRAMVWLPTNGNSIYANGVQSDTQIVFKIYGYKTGQ